MGDERVRGNNLQLNNMGQDMRQQGIIICIN